MKNLIELKNTDLMLVFEDKDLKLKLSIFWNGGNFCSFIFEQNKIELMRGNDFKPSSLHYIDNNKTMICLLGFMTVQKGDTDLGFFKDHSPEMLAWLETFECEELKGLVGDMDMPESEYFPDAKKYFDERILQYPEINEPQLLMF